MSVSVRVFGAALADYAPVARVVDDLGFTGVWVPDHVVAMTDVATVYPYSETGRPRFAGHTPWADPVTMLAHLAAVTSRVRLGIGVFVLPLRHPLHVARSLLTVQELSGGRLRLGVGVGWNAEEFAALGAPFERRGSRAEEMVGILRRAWSGEPFAWAGEHHRFAELRVSPPMTTPVPVLWGGATDVSVRRAVRMADGLYGPPGDREATLTLLERVRAELDRAGRDWAGFRFVARCPEPFHVSGVVELAEAGVDEVVVNVPRDLVEVGAQVDWLHDAAARLRAAGVVLDQQRDGTAPPASRPVDPVRG